jgi:hypothetical protein
MKFYWKGGIDVATENQKRNYERYRELPLNGDFQIILENKYPEYKNTPRVIATIRNMEYWHEQIGD